MLPPHPGLASGSLFSASSLPPFLRGWCPGPCVLLALGALLAPAASRGFRGSQGLPDLPLQQMLRSKWRPQARAARHVTRSAVCSLDAAAGLTGPVYTGRDGGWGGGACAQVTEVGRGATEPPEWLGLPCPSSAGSLPLEALRRFHLPGRTRPDQHPGHAHIGCQGAGA